MTQMQLIQHISAFDKHIKIVKLRRTLIEQPFSLRELVDLTFYPDKAIALKASRLLETMLVKFPKNYVDDIAYLVAHVADVNCMGCKKHYAKVIMHITSPDVPKEVRDVVKDIDFDKVVELCLAWLADPKMLTRVRASASEALFNLRHRYPWIAEALSAQLEAMVPTATPMLQARGNFILSFLHPED
ncbi:MAG: hypothetical protein ACHQHN_14385 [Sphingobacteriales bacterium]